MKFTIKQQEETKCASCVHAFRIKAYANPNTLNICRVLNTAVGKIEQCSYHTLITYTQPPASMLLTATLIDVERKRVAKMGFGGKAVIEEEVNVRSTSPPSPEELFQAAENDPETFIVNVPSDSK